MHPSTYKRFQHEKLTSTGTSDVKTATIPGWTSAIHVTVETNPARITLDGTDPTTGVGNVYPASAGPILLLAGPGAILQAVATTGSSTVQLTYFS